MTGPAGPGPSGSGTQVAVAFGGHLRAAGVDVGVAGVLAFVEALALVDASRRAGVYWAGRATLVHDPEDLVAYDAAFERFWAGTGVGDDVAVVPVPVPVVLEDPDADDGSEADDDGARRPTRSVRFSAAEVLRHKDFAECTADELAQIQRMAARLRLGGAWRPSRRLRPARSGPGRRPDLRATVRQSLRDGGEPIHRRWRSPSQRPRRVVALVDVSGSMEPYARALLGFVHATVVGRRRVEVFTLGTRLTRVTRQLAGKDPDAALAAATATVADWSGGTRLGQGLAAFNDEWGVRGLARGAVVVVLSDGWDRGDPAFLGEQMARLHRVAHKVVWVNPLKATPGYAPLARGMAAALPYVDHFVEGHSLDAMERLAALLNGGVDDVRREPAGRGGGAS